MVANNVTIEANPAARILDMASLMERVAANGEWKRTEQLAAKLKTAVLEVPARERGRLMTSIVDSIEKVQTMAMASRAEVTEKISGIRRGRDATRAYGQPAAQG